MTVTVNETDILNELNFDFAPPCEALCHEEARHDLPAELIIDVTCVCGLKARIIVCVECLGIMLNSVLGCGDCGQVDPGRDCVHVVGKV